MTSTKPNIVFVCSSNQGKSQIAAALARHLFGDRATISSAGTNASEQPACKLNAEAKAVVTERGASMDGEHPKPLRITHLQDADMVIVLGSNANLDPAITQLEAEGGQRPEIITWHPVEPSKRGIEGRERMELLVDDIQRHVESLQLPEPGGR